MAIADAAQYDADKELCATLGSEGGLQRRLAAILAADVVAKA
jgi:hypothetical protein